MGVTSAPAAGLDLPATRLVVTPPGEIALCCRLALASRLRRELPEDALQFVLGRHVPSGRPGAGVRHDWETAYSLLPGLRVIDPACGAGDFLLGVLTLLQELEGFLATRLGYAHDAAAVLGRICAGQLCGVEVRGPTLALAARRLQARARVEPTLLLDDSLLPHTAWAREVLAPGGFDLVVGNPPFVRHERIADPLSRLSAQAYRAAILDQIREPPRQSVTFNGGTPQRGIDGRSDLSALFLLHGVSLLRREGVLAYVLPSALAQARYGHAVSAAVAATGHEALAVESVTHRSFVGVDVNTSVVLVTPGPHRDPESGFKRVEIEGRLDERQAATVWIKASRARCAQASALAGSPPLVPLGTLGRLRYPIKTGLNRFFYPDAGIVAQFGIESRYLQPVLKTPREVGHILLESRSLRGSVFICGDDPKALEPGAAGYIEWGSRQQTARGIRWPDVPSVRGRNHWFALPLPARADVICPRFFDRRLFFVVPEDAVLEDQTFYGLILAPEYRKRRELIAALLTCSPTCLSLEMHGRTGLGDGVRQYALCDMATLPVPDPGQVPDSQAGTLVEAFRVVARRPILAIEEEIQQPDRRALDDAAGEAFGVTSLTMQAVRQEVVERVRQRLSRARTYS